MRRQKYFQDRDPYSSRNTVSDLSPCGTLRSTDWSLVIDVSRKLKGFILRRQAVQEESTLPNITEQPTSHLNRSGSQNSGTLNYIKKEPNIL